MKALDRKLLRDVWNMKGQLLAITMVLAAGVATFVMSLCTLSSLQDAQAYYYERYRFAQVFTHIKRAPNFLAERLAELPGVARVQTRIVADVNLDVPGFSEPAVGRIISVAGPREGQLNALYLRGGRYPEARRPGEVLVGEAFAQAHALKPGDRLTAILNGRKQSLRIVGVALSPEYIYSIREGQLVPDDRRFGVIWMGYAELAAAFDMQGAFNDVALSLLPTASEPEVLRWLDRLTEPYGGIGSYGRDDQLSYKFIANELTQLRSMAWLPPSIFLSVAAFLLNVVLARLVSTQREQIATLRAFGYTRREIAWHYLKLVLLIVILGVSLGTAVGAWLGRDLTALYAQFFRFPVFGFSLRTDVVLLALAIGIVAALLGTWTAIWRACRLPPAEAMQPEPPASFRPTLLARLGLEHLLALPARMIIRQLERQPRKALASILGISLALGVLVLGNFIVDSADQLMDFQFFATQRHDVSVTFVEPTSVGALHDVQHLPGVRLAEPFRSVPVRVRSGHRWRRLGLLGLEPDAELFRLMDRQGRVVSLATEGLVVSAKLAEVLEVQVGDSVTVEILERDRPVREVVITGLFHDFTSPAAYMHRGALSRLLREGDALSGAFLAVDAGRVDELYRRLKAIPRIAQVNLKRATLESFRTILSENLLRMKTINVIFASIIAFGVVYNSARISLSERSRELATLRVLGFTRAEISVILLGELAVLTLAALPVGLALGYGLAGFATWALDTETQRFPLVVDPSTYGFAAAVTMVAALVSGLSVRRRLDRLDLVAVLKARE